MTSSNAYLPGIAVRTIKWRGRDGSRNHPPSRPAYGSWPSRSRRPLPEANLAADLMARMGHSSTRAALIYQHTAQQHDREIADALSGASLGSAIGHVTGTASKAMAGVNESPGPA
jgi:hypothetical protein